ncbi:MAG: hypothetical protein V7L29_22760 [Nostoc sp.]|uniref:hypothetical protein n=1 Tax=Nostoc sp. TaxID=1180 RepID=UPI002FF32422
MRLQFSTKVSQVFSGKRQVYKGLGRADTSENRQWAEGIGQQYQLILIAQMQDYLTLA